MTELSDQFDRTRAKKKGIAPVVRESGDLGPGLTLFRPFFHRKERTPLRAATVLGVTALAMLVVAGCDLAPRKPEDVYTVYREHMRSGNLEEARELLTRDSGKLAREITAKFKLEEAPERLAIFNALDPAGPPLIMKQGDNYTLIQVRTLRGGVRLVRLIRKDAESPWRIDLSEELQALRRFFRLKAVLDMFREQAGEYAESWKAFNDQLERMRVSEDGSAKEGKDKEANKRPTTKTKRPRGGSERRR